MSKKKSEHSAEVLEMILRETQAKTGTNYFRAIVRNLAESLGAWGCWITEYFPKTRHMVALAFWSEGKYIQHYEYDIEGTACQPAVEKARTYHIGNRLVELFPESDVVVKTRAVSYIGSPIMDLDGNVIGLLGLMDTKPLTNKVSIDLFELFVERAGAELLRMRMEKAVIDREERMRMAMNSFLDAVMMLDADLKVVTSSQSASKIFGFTEENLNGQCLLKLLNKPSGDQIQVLTQSLMADAKDHKSVYIKDNLVALKQDQTEFPAEASLSIFELNARPHFCLVLRDLNDVFESEKRIESLTRETEALRASVRELSGAVEIIGESSPMRNLNSHIERVARTHSSVLIIGETGSGKELVARAIHKNSFRAKKPLVCINCAALPENLIESELFGHSKGAFTGANDDREGRFTQANGGTLFLDEVGELPLAAQAKLLRVLQEGEYEPVGSSETLRADVRVIAATHRDFGRQIKAGKFRQDLFYRLNVFPIRVPPLRERGNDILLLSESIISKLSQQMGKRIQPLDERTQKALLRHNWPGNVRELQNTLERAMIVSGNGQLELLNLLPNLPRSSSDGGQGLEMDETTILTIQELRGLEKQNIERALKTTGGRVSGDKGAAILLEMKPTTLASRIKALGIEG